MKKLYDKNELKFSLMWIVLYVVLFSLADSVSESIGAVKSVTAILCIMMTSFIYYWIHKNGLSEKYGLCRPEGDAKLYLYYIPLILLASTNLWWGVTLNLSVMETVLYIISMIGVGFLEEVIFRGFLFKSMCKSNVRQAIMVSSITFGIGHIVNLLNGKDVTNTLLQVCYAIAIGYLFTIIFYKGKSLWPCIITHATINSLSVFAVRADGDIVRNLAGGVFLCVVALGYAGYILKKSDNLAASKE